MLKNITLFAFVLLVLVGCDSYLDVKPKGFTIPELVNDYQQLINEQGLIRASPAYPDFLSDHVQSGDYEDAIRGASFNAYPTVKKRLYRFEHGAIFEEGSNDPYWSSAYNHIFTYNVIINNVLDAIDGSDAEKNRIWAEAKVGRAFEYLSLVNIYAKHYNQATASEDLGVPLVLSEDINTTYERATVQEIYDLVESDLSEALPHLASASSHKFQPLKSVGYAFLSRMYLYQGKYDLASENAEKALELNSYLEDYKVYTTKLKTTWGRVCLIEDEDVPFPDAKDNKETVWGRLGTSSMGALNAEVYASEDLVDVYGKDLPSGATDKRYDLFFLADSSSFGAAVEHFPGRVLYGPYVELNTGFSTPELYLTIAEAEVRSGSVDKGIEWLNQLRDSRIENNEHFSGVSKEKALELVLDERRRELPFTASNRLIDLKRLRVSGDLQKDIIHKLEEEEFKIDNADPRLILPVPPTVLSLNPNIPQYDR